jgi:site-specific DNA-cytosine methylase
MKNKTTYGTIVPLIGGENIGVMNAMEGQLPEWVLSYKPFTANDEHFIDYIRGKGYTGEYTYLDEEGNENYVPEKVDVVNTVCPCAGLSSLNVNSGVDYAANDWMYLTANYVLGKVKPRVFWGENAPRLFTKAGSAVADKLAEIAKEHGYSLNLYYTESRLHGLSQKRPRTFYFFTDSKTAPIFPWYRKPQESIEDILKQKPIKDDPMNVTANQNSPYDNSWLQYQLAATGTKTIAELQKTFTKTENLIVHSDGGYNKGLSDVADWMEANGHDKVGARARAMQEKLDQGKGYWAHGITIPRGNEIPALIGALPHSLLNPYTDNWITIRDCLRIMKMPDDFNLVGENVRSKVNHICQNVPASTAEDMMKNVLLYLEGHTEFAPTPRVRQNNKKQDVLTEDGNEVSNTLELDAFFDLHS